jgi:hypothetical protein
LKRYLVEILSLLLIAGSMVFFYECIRFLTRRDYIAAAMLLVIGISVMRVGSELARLVLLGKR